MKILFMKDNTKEYIAKIYWSLQKGLRQFSELICYGKNQDVEPTEINYNLILKKCYKDELPNLIITDFIYNDLRFKTDGLFNIDKSIKTAVIIGDYWSIPDKQKFIYIMEKIDYIFTFFYEFIDLYPMLKEKIIFVPPSVDTEIFHDWKLEKEYKIGFLGDGTTIYKPVYPERFRITNLLKNNKYNFYYDNHPGWGFFNENHSLVGAGFSKAINKCKMFISTAGTIGHCNPKYYEIPASGSVLIAGDCKYFDKTGFIDEESCLTFKNDKELLEKINSYSDEQLEKIKNKGLEIILKYHTAEIRAKEILRKISL